MIVKTIELRTYIELKSGIWSNSSNLASLAVLPGAFMCISKPYKLAYRRRAAVWMQETHNPIILSQRNGREKCSNSCLLRIYNHKANANGTSIQLI